MVVDRSHLDELLDAPEEVLSFHGAFSDALELANLFNASMAKDSYHVAVVRTKLTQSINSTMEACVQEMKAAFEEVIHVTNGISTSNMSSLPDTEWTPLVAYQKFLHIATRMTNYRFVGLPLC